MYIPLQYVASCQCDVPGLRLTVLGNRDGKEGKGVTKIQVWRKGKQADRPDSVTVHKVL